MGSKDMIIEYVGDIGRGIAVIAVCSAFSGLYHLMSPSSVYGAEPGSGCEAAVAAARVEGRESAVRDLRDEAERLDSFANPLTPDELAGVDGSIRCYDDCVMFLESGEKP